MFLLWLWITSEITFFKACLKAIIIQNDCKQKDYGFEDNS